MAYIRGLSQIQTMAWPKNKFRKGSVKMEYHLKTEKEKILHNKLCIYMNKKKVEEEVDNSNILECDKHDELLTYSDSIAPFIHTMKSTEKNEAYRSIWSCRKFVGPIILFFKKVIRKCLKWYIEPICDQQSEFNYASRQVSEIVGNQLREFNEKLDKKELFDEISKEIAAFLVKMNELEESIANESERNQVFQNIIDEKLCDDKKKRDEQCHQVKEMIDKFDQIQTIKYDFLLKSFSNLTDQYQMLTQQNTTLSMQQNTFLHSINEVKNSHNALSEQIIDLSMQQTTFVRSMGEVNNSYDKVTQKSQEIDSNVKKIEEFIDQIIPNSIPREKDYFNKKSYSQSGEDAIISYILLNYGLKMSDVTYLDLGANHGKSMSNTFFFYEQGARGVLVEANTALVEELYFLRRDDIVLNRCIAPESGKTVTFYVLNGDGLSTPDLEGAFTCIKANPNLKIINQLEIKTISVNDIIEKYFKKAPILLNIDIEGMELDILESIDFETYRPLIIVCEMIDYKPELVIGKKNTVLLKALESYGYTEYAFTGINSIFIDQRKSGGNL